MTDHPLQLNASTLRETEFSRSVACFYSKLNRNVDFSTIYWRNIALTLTRRRVQYYNEISECCDQIEYSVFYTNSSPKQREQSLSMNGFSNCFTRADGEG
ncbi:MAG: hypothetical protein ABFD03_10785 [Clostridiaceae bacterium]